MQWYSIFVNIKSCLLYVYISVKNTFTKRGYEQQKIREAFFPHSNILTEKEERERERGINFPTTCWTFPEVYVNVVYSQILPEKHPATGGL